VAETACVGVCNSRYREAREAYEQAVKAYDPLDPDQSRPQPPDITPYPGAPVWCGRCASLIRHRLGELDDLAAILQAYADGHRDAPDGQRVSGTQGTMSPSQAGDDADELSRMLGGWEQAYREMRGWPSPRRSGDLASWVTSCCAWLITHLDGILACDVARDFGEEILGWHREFTGKAKAGVRKLRKPMRCPGCQLLMLAWVEGDEYVRCSNPSCGRSLSLPEYEALVEIRAGTREEAA